jgi:hypothetical protein
MVNPTGGSAGAQPLQTTRGVGGTRRRPSSVRRDWFKSGTSVGSFATRSGYPGDRSPRPSDLGIRSPSEKIMTSDPREGEDALYDRWYRRRR